MTESVESLNSRISLPVSGGTLSDLLAQQKRLAFSTALDYLDQLSEAIDLAHEQGFIHRSLNPSTILLTAEGQLVLPDLRSAGGIPRQTTQQKNFHVPVGARTLANMRLMALAYMAPEQILEGNILSPEARRVSNIAGMDRPVDGRADLYSLGVLLYQMVTGVLPFQDETPEQVALKHLRMPPPSPRQLRPDLPVAAEQAMLRALAKRPSDRYVRAQDLATAFRVALIAADIQLDDHPYVEVQPITQESLFDPALQSEIVPTVRSFQPADNEAVGAPAPLQAAFQASHDNDVDESQPTTPIPVVNAALSLSTDDSTTLISPTSQETFPDELVSPATQETFSPTPTSPIEALSGVWGTSINSFAPLEPIPAGTDARPTVMPHGYDPISPLPGTSTTGMLALSNFQQGNTGTLKLTGPAKIVQVPVAGQPGVYVTGLLPVFPQQSSPTGTLASAPLAQNGRNKGRIILMLALVVMIVVFGSGLFWFIHTHPSQTNRQTAISATPNLKATATAHAIATINANVILVDPLNQNIHNWPIATSGSMIYVFKDGAYHITDNNPTQGASAILRDEVLQGSFAYTLTMEEIRGDDTSVNNEIGMIIRANSQNKYGKMVTTFYSFEVVNTKGGEYQFWKYDNSKGPNVTPWTKLWHHAFGKEFHQGQGPGSSNTFKIFVNGKSFTLIVNGKQIATVQDSSCNGCPCNCSGGVGMLVNLKGTEVAFSNLRLTYS